PPPPRSPPFPYTTLFRSVGVPLVERLLAYGPERLVLLDSHEDSLYRLQRRLREATPPPALLLGDVRNPARVAALFRDYRPEVVLDRKSTRLNSSHRTISY